VDFSESRWGEVVRTGSVHRFEAKPPFFADRHEKVCRIHLRNASRNGQATITL
jgi:hypothetical protein